MNEPATITLDAAVVSRFHAGREVHVWQVDVRTLSMDLLEQQAVALLDAETLMRARGTRLPETRRDHLGSQLALRRLLSVYCPSVPADHWQLLRQPGGRPCMTTTEPSECRVPSFSVAHSDGMVLLAFHQCGDVGVDIESELRAVDGLTLARRYFSSEEVDELGLLPSAERHAAFLRHWTLKEASVKADGVGLAGEMRRRRFSISGPATLWAVRFDARRWQYWSLRLQDDWWVAVGLRHPEEAVLPPVRCVTWQLSLVDGVVGVVTPGLLSQSAVL